MLAKKRKISKSQLALIGSFLLILSGLLVIGNHYFYQSNKEIKEQEKIEEFFEEEKDEQPKVELNEVENTKEEVKEDKTEYDYIAVLEIESLNLKRGLVSPDSKYNNVKYNIQIMETSSMPNIENGNLILAGHNGTSYVSFFKNLYKMKDGDLINIYYQGYKYVYKYTNSYEVNKTGIVSIIRDKSKNTITLITCKKGSKDKQLVFIGYLVDKVEY